MASGSRDPDFRLGIDFGTSHTTAILRWPDGHTRPILFDGSPLLPSAVYADTDGRLLVGRDAIHAARLDPARFEPTPKRRITEAARAAGNTADETPVVSANPAPDTTDGSKTTAAQTTPDTDTDKNQDNAHPSVVDMVAAVLDRVRDEAERVSAVRIDQIGITLTHPAGWDVEHIAVLMRASQQAGLGEPVLVPEPVAAAGYFVAVLGRTIPEGSALVVYDFGGGTFDASVVRPRAKGNDGNRGYEVLAVAGLDDVGGIDLDLALLRHVADAHRDADPDAWARLEEPKTAADRRHRRHLIEDVRAAKEMLSRAESATVPVPLLELEARITRADFDALARPFLDRTVATTGDVIASADTEVAAVLLVGGSSRILLVSELLRQRTGIEPSTIDQPETVVAEGSLRLPQSAADAPLVAADAIKAADAIRAADAVTAPDAAKAAAEAVTPIIPARPVAPNQANRQIGRPVDPWATSEQPTADAPLLPPVPPPDYRQPAGQPITARPVRPGPTRPMPPAQPTRLQQGPRPMPPGPPPQRYESPARNRPPQRKRRRTRSWPMVLLTLVGLAAIGAGAVVAWPYLNRPTNDPGFSPDPQTNTDAGRNSEPAAGPSAGNTTTPSAAVTPYVRTNPPDWLPSGWRELAADDKQQTVVAGPATNGGTCQYLAPGVLHVTRDRSDVSGCNMTAEVKQNVVQNVAVEAEFKVVAGCAGIWVRTGARGYFVAVCADQTVQLHELADDPPSDATRIGGPWKPGFDTSNVVVGLIAENTGLTVVVNGVRQPMVVDDSIGNGRVGVGGFAPDHTIDATITRFRAWTPTGSGG